MTTLSPTVRERVSVPAQAMGEAGSAPSPAEFFGMLRRRAVLIVVLFTLLSGAAVGGWVTWWKYYPGYRSEALIECISNLPEAELSVEQRQMRQDELERFVRTQAVLLKSPSVLSEALRVTAVHETEWFKSVGPGQHLLKLADRLTAAPVRGTNVLRVAMVCRDLKDPKVIVNEVVARWYDSVKKRAAEEFADERLAAAKLELEGIDREITELNDRLKNIMERLPPGATQIAGATVLHEQVRQISGTIQQLELEQAQLGQYKELYDSADVAITSEDRAMVEQDPGVFQMQQSVSLLEQQRAAAIQVYGPAHKVLRQLDAQISATQTTLDALRMERTLERQADMREMVRTAYDNNLHALFTEHEALQKTEGELQDQDRLLYQYRTVNDELLLRLGKRVQFTDYINNLTRIKTQRRAIRVSIAQPAIDPLERSSPSIFLLPVGVFLALLMSGGIAIGLEMLDKSVRTSQDIIRHLNVPLLGLVPHTDDEQVAIQSVETVVRDAPQSMMAEVFRRIRTNLQFSAPAEHQRSLVITSPAPEDGKTTVACNVAIAIAQGGRRVLLVDANFRRPGVARIFQTGKVAGLSNVLAGEGALSSFTAKTDVPLLDVLESGPLPANPIELLGSDLCRSFLDEAMSLYDQVIIDAAPVLLATDTLVLGSLVDGVVVVVRANKNSRGVVRRACNLLADAGVHLFGAVLNAAQVTRGGYFREQLRTHYEYQPDAAETAKAQRAISKKREPGVSDEEPVSFD